MTLPPGKLIHSPHGKVANDDTVGPDKDEDDRDDDFESGGQSLGSESSGGIDSDASGAADDKGDERPHRKDGRVQVQTRRPWLKSGDERLVAYKSKMGMISPLPQLDTRGSICALVHITREVIH